MRLRHPRSYWVAVAQDLRAAMGPDVSALRWDIP